VTGNQGIKPSNPRILESSNPVRHASRPVPHIVLGVTGSIAAYKALEIVRRLKRRGALVSVVMTKSAQELVTPLSFESVSGNRVYTDMWSKQRDSGPVTRWSGRQVKNTGPLGHLATRPLFRRRDAGVRKMEHIDLAQSANLLLVAPASANILGKVASGIADDLLSTVIMATRAPVVFAPAMNDQMWTNPIVQRNVAWLRELGYGLIEPESGSLACGTEGPGRLADVETICDAAIRIAEGRPPTAYRLPPTALAGKTVIVALGRTEEEIDPVRVITNRSSGRMGIAIAQAARLAGAKVKVVAGKTSVPIPDGFDPVRVTSTEEMLAELKRLLPDADILFMVAAPADFRPKARSRDKRKDRNLVLELERTPDILTELGKVRHHAKLVGFSIESQDLLTNSKAKLVQKKLDMIVANPVETLDSEQVKAVLIRPSAAGQRTMVKRLPEMSKPEFADRLVAEVARTPSQGTKESRNRGIEKTGIRESRNQGIKGFPSNPGVLDPLSPPLESSNPVRRKEKKHGD
jgi:phosphopantothenoylcysteine decarboxylase/phosphopantothenate--cysteine ligase